MANGYPTTIGEYRQQIKDFGTCLGFDGTQGSISLGTTNPFTGNFYFSAWVKWYGLNGSFQHIFAKRDSYATNDMMFDLALSDTTGQLLTDTTVGQRLYGYYFPKFKWVHLVWVHNITDGFEQIYINGEKISEQAISTLGDDTTALISIGAVQSPSIEWFNGQLDEIVIGQSAPSWQEVVAMYAKYSYLSVWRYFKLDEGSGTTATDSSSNGVNGTIANATYVTDKVLTTRTSVTNRFLLPTSSQKSLSFNGTSDFATVNFTLASTGFNIGFWLFLKSGSANASFFGDIENANQNGFSIGTGATFGLLQASMKNAGVTTIFQTINQNIRGKWVYVTYTFVPNSGKFYINNVAAAPTDTTCLMSTPTINIYIGQKDEVNTTRTALQMQYLTIQNSATPWTQTQMDDLYYRNIIPTGATQWSLNNVVTDQDGGNALTLTGTTYSTNTSFQPRTAV